MLTADLVVTNATVHTMNPDEPLATWFAVLAGNIVAVGSGGDVPPAKEVIDAGGQTIVPGFFDAHCHTMWFGLSLAELDCTQFSTLDALYEALALEAAGVEAGSWVLATGFNQERFGGQYPELSALDRAVGENPLFIRHTSGHAAIVNSLALELSNVAEAMAGLDGGAVVVDSSGNPTGVLEERAQTLVQALLLPKSMPDMVAALGRASLNYASQGLTSFTETGVAGGWIGHSPVEFASYQRARQEGLLLQRAQVMPVSDVLQPITGHATDPAFHTLPSGIFSGVGDDWLSVGPTKIFLDGSMLAWTGAMSEPLSAGPPDNYGYFQAPEEDLRNTMLDAAAAGWAIAAHAIGDRAVALALDTFEEAVSRCGQPPLPHRIEHGGVVTDEQVTQAARLGVGIVTQPGFMPALGVQMREAMGPARERFLHRHKSLLEAGVLTGGSSDRPVATGVPLEVIHSMVTRLDATGYVVGEKERVSVKEALWTYTVGSSQVTGTSHRRGSIEVGKVADWVVLDKDILHSPVDDIPDIRVVETRVGGQQTFTAP